MLAHAAPEAIIIPFPAAEFRQNRLTMRDRMRALAWAETARKLGYHRVVIRERHPEDDPQIGDHLAIYRAGEPWAAWGIARHGASLRVWRCATGADLGDFDTIDEALDAVAAATPGSEARLTRRPA
jgi:hypothetical protein